MIAIIIPVIKPLIVLVICLAIIGMWVFGLFCDCDERDVE